jgi:hypothetical protein
MPFLCFSLAGACHDARVASSQTSQSAARAGPAIRRVLASASVAGVLGLAFWLVFSIGSGSRFFAGDTCGGPAGCLMVAVFAVLAGLLAIVVVAWPLLRVAGVRPAWPVALLGPFIALSAYREFTLLADHGLVPGLWILLAVSYAAAAVITAPRLYQYWSAVAAMAVVALDLAMALVAGR